MSLLPWDGGNIAFRRLRRPLPALQRLWIGKYHLPRMRRLRRGARNPDLSEMSWPWPDTSVKSRVLSGACKQVGHQPYVKKAAPRLSPARQGARESRGLEFARQWNDSDSHTRPAKSNGMVAVLRRRTFIDLGSPQGS